jgi:rubrerythrin
MGIEFNADEILEMAQQIERNGAKFYRKASEGAKTPKVRQMLLDLAAWEDRHEQVFAEMRKQLTQQERTTNLFDPYDEASLYLKAMADGHVFDVKADPASRLTGKEPMEQVFKTAIGLEKDSIVFYLGLRGMVPERLGEGKIDDIIKEEMGHITFLSKQMAEGNG